MFEFLNFKHLKNYLKQLIVPYVAWVIYKLFYFTWNIKIFEPPEMKNLLINKKPFILAHWHGDELALIHVVSRYKIATMVSLSKDGEMMDRLVKLLGGITSRGSSSKGGVSALKGLIKLLKNGRNTSVAVDGPRGPIYKVKPGVFEISKLTKAPIFWCGVVVDRQFVSTKSWNKAILPKPFARIYIEWRGPFQEITSDTDPKSKILSQILEDNLNAAKHQLSKKFDVHNAQC